MGGLWDCRRKGEEKIHWLKLSEYINADEGRPAKLNATSFLFQKRLNSLVTHAVRAKVKGGFSEGKAWSDWKLDYLTKKWICWYKRTFACCRKTPRQGLGIVSLLQESTEKLQKRHKSVPQEKVRSTANQNSHWQGPTCHQNECCSTNPWAHGKICEYTRTPEKPKMTHLNLQVGHCSFHLLKIISL